MSEREIQRLQNKIKRLLDENTQIKNEKQKLRRQLQAQYSKSKYLQHKIDNLPISLVSAEEQQSENMEDQRIGKPIASHPFQNHSSNIQIELLENKIALIQSQLLFFKKRIEEKDLKIYEDEERHNHLLLLLKNKEHQFDELKMQYDSDKQLYEFQTKNIEKSQLQFQKLKEEKQKLIQLNFTLTNQNKQLKANQSKLINETINKLKKIYDQVQRQVGEIQNQAPNQQTIQNYQKKEAELSSLVTSLLIDVKQKNQQLSHLSQSQNSATFEQSMFLNTITHLKRQLVNKSAIITNILKKSQQAEKIISNFKNLTEQYQKKLVIYLQTQQKFDFIKSQLQIAKIERNELKNEVQKFKKMIHDYQINMIQILQENECYHRFMYEMNGSNYLNAIRSEREEYERRQQKRQQQQNWVNINELIKLNEKLLQRIK